MLKRGLVTKDTRRMCIWKICLENSTFYKKSSWYTKRLKLIGSLSCKTRCCLLDGLCLWRHQNTSSCTYARVCSCCPLKKSRKTWAYDTKPYKRRTNLAFFLRIKRFRKVFTCYDEFDINLFFNCNFDFNFWCYFYVNML